MPTPSQHSKELNSKDIRIVVYILIVGMLMVLSVIFWAARTVRAQEKEKPKFEVVEHGTGRPVEYKLTEIQQLKLQVIQKDALLLKLQKQEIDKQFADKVTELMSTAQKIKLENSWPPETTFNPDNLQFSAPEKETKK